MQKLIRAAFASLASATVLLVSIDALACQELVELPMQQQLDEAIGVVHAKVVRAEVTTLEEVGITCDAVNCDLLEIKLDIREVFKGTADDYVSIHAAVPTMCFVPIVAGWEYVLFLEEFEGLIFSSERSFPIHGGTDMPRLVELRSLTAN